MDVLTPDPIAAAPAGLGRVSASTLRPRVLAALLLVLAILCISAGAPQLFRSWNDIAWSNLCGVKITAELVAGTIFGVTALRVLRAPERLSRYVRGLTFWRWLAGGVIAMFFIVGLWNYSLDDDWLRGPSCRALCALWLAMMLVPLAAPGAGLERGRSWLTSAPFRLADLLMGNFVLLVLLCETALRAWTLFTGQDPLMLERVAARRMPPGVHEHGVRANSLGFPDQEFQVGRPSGIRRIAALGDSFSVGVRVAYEENYLTLLEEKLPGVEVLNFGVSGTGPREYRKLLSDTVWPYQPDLVLVPIFVGNDIQQWIPTPKLRKFEPDALHSVVFLQRLGRLVRERWRGPSTEGSLFSMRVSPQFSERTYVEMSATRLDVCRLPQTPFITRCWQRALAELELIVADCKAHDVPLAVLVLPDELQVNQDLRRRGLAHRGLSDSDVDVLLPQRRLAEFCASRGVPCLDLEPALRTAGGAAYYPNDSHWNALGNRLAADAASPWLLEHFRAVLVKYHGAAPCAGLGSS